MLNETTATETAPNLLCDVALERDPADGHVTKCRCRATRIAYGWGYGPGSESGIRVCEWHAEQALSDDAAEIVDL